MDMGPNWNAIEKERTDSEAVRRATDELCKAIKREHPRIFSVLASRSKRHELPNSAQGK